MKRTSSDSHRSGSVNADPDRVLFTHEVRREGRLVVTLTGRRDSTGVVVDSEVFAVTQAPTDQGSRRPFTFTTLDQARQFVEEVLITFEYLNCSVT